MFLTLVKREVESRARVKHGWYVIKTKNKHTHSVFIS